MLSTIAACPSRCSQMLLLVVAFVALAAPRAAARRGDQYRLPPYVLGDAEVDAYGRGTAAQRLSHSGVDGLGRAMTIDALIHPLRDTVTLDAASNVTSVHCSHDLTRLTVGVEDVGAALADWSASTLLIVGAGWGCRPPHDARADVAIALGSLVRRGARPGSALEPVSPHATARRQPRSLRNGPYSKSSDDFGQWQPTSPARRDVQDIKIGD